MRDLPSSPTQNGSVCAASWGSRPGRARRAFASLADRLHHQDALDGYIESWTRQHTAEEVMTRLQEAAVAAGVVCQWGRPGPRPTTAGAGVLGPAAGPGKTGKTEEVILDGPPFKLSQTPGYVATPGPFAG